MSTKTISLRIEAYERLRRARLRADESFSDVVMRAQWPGSGMLAGELRTLYETQGPHFSEDELDSIEAIEATDRPPRDKWTDP